MDDLNIYNCLKQHLSLLRVIIDQCRKLQISLNLKKCNFVVHFGTLLGHIVCKLGVSVDVAKVVSILNMPILIRAKQLRSTLGHTCCYYRFIHNYTLITIQLEKLLNKLKHFIWTFECDAAFDTLKYKLVSSPILVYPNWNKKFNVRIDASSTTLGIIIALPREGNLDHLMYFSIRKISTVEHNYTMN